MWRVLLLVLGVNGQFDPLLPCFCKGEEAIYDCECPNSIDSFNSVFFPALQNLLSRDFFRFYKVNMDRPCPFWPDDRECASRECGVEACDDKVPEGLRHRECNGEGNSFDPMDRSISAGEKEQLDHMDTHEEMENKFCDVEDEHSSGMHYVDLSKNPERYTGYKGDSALRVWKSIYQENCFKPDMRFDKNFLSHPNTFGLCLEKRVFYRLISGLHSAITISIASHNYKPAVGGFGEGTWFRNVEMFANRFGTKWSWEGPQRLKNIYFVFLLELRALVKAAPLLSMESFYTGNEKEDSQTVESIRELLAIAEQMPNPFDETDMFTGVDATARELREEFRAHFHNISRIMDCVGCDKCRLWGKVQVHGMGTALKILFSRPPANAPLPQLKLTRNEMLALLQSLGRYSSSINEIAEFRNAMGIVIPSHSEL